MTRHPITSIRAQPSLASNRTIFITRSNCVHEGGACSGCPELGAHSHCAVAIAGYGPPRSFSDWTQTPTSASTIIKVALEAGAFLNNTVQIGTSAIAQNAFLLPRQWDPSHFTFLVPFRAILTSGFVMFLTRCCHCLLAVHRRGQRHNSGVRRNDAL